MIEDRLGAIVEDLIWASKMLFDAFGFGAVMPSGSNVLVIDYVLKHYFLALRRNFSQGCFGRVPQQKF